jgi:hypothetical protein
MSTSVAEFAARGYVVQRGVFNSSSLDFYYRYALEQAACGQMALDDTQAPRTPSKYADPTMEMLLEKLCPTVERTTGLSLFPTYSFFRVYKEGDVLKRHRDRPSCEISVTLCLGYDPDDPWPIFVEGPMAGTSVTLKPGDALIYRGCECPHWRNAYAGNHAAQVFLHYVDQKGPNAEWKFDKRSGVASLRHLMKSRQSSS